MSSQFSPDPLAGLMGPTSEKEGEGRGENGVRKGTNQF